MSNIYRLSDKETKERIKKALNKWVEHLSTLNESSTVNLIEEMDPNFLTFSNPYEDVHEYTITMNIKFTISTRKELEKIKKDFNL